VLLIVPRFSCTLQVTAVFVVPVTVAVNDCVVPRNRVAVFGVTVTLMTCEVGAAGEAGAAEPPPHPPVVTAATTTKAKPVHACREVIGRVSYSWPRFAPMAFLVNPAQNSNFSSGPHELKA
jgi:hypothetical protein